MERDSNSDAGEQAEASRGSEWEQVEQTSAFEELVRKKKAFILPAAIFYFMFFTAWIVLGQFTTVLDGRAIGAMTWASVYGLTQFVIGITSVSWTGSVYATATPSIVASS